MWIKVFMGFVNECAASAKRICVFFPSLPLVFFFVVAILFHFKKSIVSLFFAFSLFYYHNINRIVRNEPNSNKTAYLTNRSPPNDTVCEHPRKSTWFSTACAINAHISLGTKWREKKRNPQFNIVRSSEEKKNKTKSFHFVCVCV